MLLDIEISQKCKMILQKYLSNVFERS